MNIPVRRDDLRFDVRVDLAYSLDALDKGVYRSCLEGDWAIYAWY